MIVATGGRGGAGDRPKREWHRVGMDLTVILGPMKGGKSLEMISLLSPLQHAGIPHRIYQSARHGRDTAVTSRSGGSLQTVKVHSLAGAADGDVEVIGVDEIHMFTVDDIAVLGCRGPAGHQGGRRRHRPGSPGSAVRAGPGPVRAGAGEGDLPAGGV